MHLPFNKHTGSFALKNVGAVPEPFHVDYQRERFVVRRSDDPDIVVALGKHIKNYFGII